jgi:hypothetical protein
MKSFKCECGNVVNFGDKATKTQCTCGEKFTITWKDGKFMVRHAK